MDTEPPKPEWVDPWLKEQAARERPYEGPAADGALTRRDCAILGAKAFVIGAASSCAIILLVSASTLFTPSSLNLLPRLEFELLFILFPPAALIGGIAGFKYYRLLTGPLAALEDQSSALNTGLGCLMWVALGIFMHIFALTMYLIFRSRRTALAKMQTAWLTFALCLLFIALIVLGVASERHPNAGDVVAFQAMCALISLGASDAWLLNRMITMRNQNGLAVPDTRKFQFSLGTMLLIVWGFGAWITGLVMMARG